MTSSPNSSGKMSLIDLVFDHSQNHKEIVERQNERFKILSDHLAARGFDDLEFIGEGLSAKVVSPKDNKDIVIRIDLTNADHQRKEIPYMLQHIGHTRIKGGKTNVGADAYTSIEYLKRLDMKLTTDDKYTFVDEAEKHGYNVLDMERGSEVGWYPHQKDGEIRNVRMAVDPGAINEGDNRHSNPTLCPHEPEHPSLLDQNAENIRLAKSDPRLAEFIERLESKGAQLRAFENQRAEILAEPKIGEKPAVIVAEHIKPDVVAPDIAPAALHSAQPVSSAPLIEPVAPAAVPEPVIQASAPEHAIPAGTTEHTGSSTTKPSSPHAVPPSVAAAEENLAEKIGSWIEKIPGGKVTAGVGAAAIVGSLGWAALHKNRQEQAENELKR